MQTPNAFNESNKTLVSGMTHSIRKFVSEVFFMLSSRGPSHYTYTPKVTDTNDEGDECEVPDDPYAPTVYKTPEDYVAEETKKKGRKKTTAAAPAATVASVTSALGQASLAPLEHKELNGTAPAPTTTPVPVTLATVVLPPSRTKTHVCNVSPDIQILLVQLFDRACTELKVRLDAVKADPTQIMRRDPQYDPQYQILPYITNVVAGDRNKKLHKEVTDKYLHNIIYEAVKTYIPDNDYLVEKIRGQITDMICWFLMVVAKRYAFDAYYNKHSSMTTKNIPGPLAQFAYEQDCMKDFDGFMRSYMTVLDNVKVEGAVRKTATRQTNTQKAISGLSSLIGLDMSAFPQHVIQQVQQQQQAQMLAQQQAHQQALQQQALQQQQAHGAVSPQTVQHHA